MARVITSKCIGTKDTGCVSACPAGAIDPEDEVPAADQASIQINAGHFR